MSPLARTDDAESRVALQNAHKAGYRAGLLLPEGAEVDVMSAVHPGLYEPSSDLDSAYGSAVLSGIRTRREGGGFPGVMPIQWLMDTSGRWNVSLARAFARCAQVPEAWSVERLRGLHLSDRFNEATVEANRTPAWKRVDFLETPLVVAPLGEGTSPDWVLLYGQDRLEVARRSRIRTLKVECLDWTCAQVCFEPSSPPKRPQGRGAGQSPRHLAEARPGTRLYTGGHVLSTRR